MHADDPQRRGAVAHHPMGCGTLACADGAEDRLSHRMVRVLAQGPDGVPAGLVAKPGHLGCQGARHDGRVDVDAGQVDHAAPGGPVDLLAARRPCLRPAGLVPAVPDDGRAPDLPGACLEQAERLSEGRGAREVESGEGQARAGGVHVRIDEARRDEGAAQVDDAVGAVAVRRGGGVLAQPGHLVPVDEHRGRERAGRRVDRSPDEQHAVGGAPGGRGHVAERGRASARPMTMRWTWLVPSTICRALASRK